MKIKTDFTTNSSSSSFVCWGVSEDDIEGSERLKLMAFEKSLRDHKEVLAKDSTRAYAKDTISNMESLTTDEEKIEYVEENGLDDELPAPLSKGGPYDYESKFVGICPTTLEKEFPEVTFGGLREFVANKMNEVLGTKLTAKDIEYYEEGWMDN
jgi:hypothetical protein